MGFRTKEIHIEEKQYTQGVNDYQEHLSSI